MNAPPADQLRGKRILLTGADGYIGTTILRQLHDVDCSVRALVPPNQDAGAVGLTQLGPNRTEVIEGDLRTTTDFRPWLDGVDLVIHLAAQTSHYEANAHPTDDAAINVAPTLRMLEWCRDNGMKPRIVFASSATVVGLPTDLPVDERAPCFPVTIYDVHKLAVEYYLAIFAREHGISSCSLRLANVYGPGLVATRPDRGILNLMVRRALEGQDLTVFGTGGWLRDYVHLRDVAAAFLRASGAPVEQISGRSFNVCTGKGTPFRDVLGLIADEAAALTGKKSRIVHEDKVLSPIDERSYIGNPRALLEATRWAPSVDLRSGVLELIELGLAQRK
jgi:nucleoside-diphosphate-sugar epimerase